MNTMHTWPVYDDRTNPTHALRARTDRRRNRILFHLMRVPFRDCDQHLVSSDRRSGFDRRNS